MPAYISEVPLYLRTWYTARAYRQNTDSLLYAVQEQAHVAYVLRVLPYIDTISTLSSYLRIYVPGVRFIAFHHQLETHSMHDKKRSNRLLRGGLGLAAVLVS